MAAFDGMAQTKMFSIRNLLMTVTIVLMAIVITLTALEMSDALHKRDRAQRAMEINALIDDIVQMKMALGGERTATYTAYGLPSIADDTFTNSIKLNRNVVKNAYNNINAQLQDLPKFDGKEFNEDIYDSVKDTFEKTQKGFREAYKDYQDKHSQVDKDLSAPGKNSMSSRKATNGITDLIEETAKLRSALEDNYDFGDDRISMVMKLKHQLWLMIEYATRESAALGENVASKTQISDIRKDQGSRYSGYGQAAWTQVRSILNSVTIAREDTTPASLKKKVEDIEKIFFHDFETTRYSLYDASDYAEPDENGDIIVDYDTSAADWVKKSDNAAAPVMAMADYASKLSRELNEQAVSDGTTGVVVSSILLIAVLVIGAFSFWVVLLRVVKPVNALSDTMMVLAQGNLEVEVPNADRGDEMGDMARSVQVFKDYQGNELFFNG